MTATQTALEREMLLVPTPGTTAERSAVDGQGEANRLQEQFDAIGHVGTAPTEPPKRSKAPLHIVRAALVILAAVSIGLVAQLAYVSRLQHHSAQVDLYNRIRPELALGTAPTGPCGQAACGKRHQPIALGTPMAIIRIPSIGVDQVVLEGTTGGVLADGPGHYLSTVFPGGAGTSVILGRQAAYGGPFGRIHDLRKGARITVVTQVGMSVFRVVDIRSGGSREHLAPATRARLTLGTAAGTAFVPSGVVYVDADKVGPALASYRPAVHTVPDSQRPMGLDTGTLWVLGLLAAALVAVFAGSVWVWRRRGHAQAWIVFSAPLVLIWMFVVDQIARLLPNLL
jgi:sortase (surface protein transpeptidase)